jgi:hypothetical protein
MNIRLLLTVCAGAWLAACAMPAPRATHADAIAQAWPAGVKEVSPIGLMTLQIPKGWVGEDGENGTAVYADPDPDVGGALRVSMTSIRKMTPEGHNEAAQREFLNDMRRFGNGFTQLDARTSLVRSVQRSTENGEPIALYGWTLGRIVNKHTLRLVRISYTVPGSEVGRQSTERELRALDASIRAARFSDD